MRWHTSIAWLLLVSALGSCRCDAPTPTTSTKIQPLVIGQGPIGGAGVPVGGTPGQVLYRKGSAGADWINPIGPTRGSDAALSTMTQTLIVHSTSGAGAATNFRGGVDGPRVELATGTTATGQARGITSNLDAYVLGTANAYEFETHLEVPNEPTVAEDYLLQIGGIDNNAGDQRDGVYIEIRRSLSSEFFVCAAANANSRTRIIMDGSGAQAGGSSPAAARLHLAATPVRAYRFRVVATSTASSCYIGDALGGWTLAGVVTATLPSTTGTGNGFGNGYRIEKLAGTTSRLLSIREFAWRLSPQAGASFVRPRPSELAPLVINTKIGATATRPPTVQVPAGFDADPTTTRPLYVFLDGFDAPNGTLQVTTLGLGTLKDQVLSGQPAGAFVVNAVQTNAAGHTFWDASNACCNNSFSGAPGSVDDVAYLNSLITQIKATYPVDATRVYLLGFSNGGFEAYHAACGLASQVAAIVSLSGMGPSGTDFYTCTPSEAVSVLHWHGEADVTVPYNGGQVSVMAPLMAVHPSAVTSTAAFATLNGCGSIGSVYGTSDLTVIAGSETNKQRYTGCPTGVDVELWHSPTDTHSITPTANMGSEFVSFLLAHPDETP